MKYSWRFVVVAGFFVTGLVVSNIIAVKLVAVSGRVFPAGLVIFPLSYVLGDVLTEVYGIRAARRVIWLGFAWSFRNRRASCGCNPQGSADTSTSRSASS